jgi:hypothetical protein
MDRVLLNVVVEHQVPHRSPALLVSEAVRRPPDLVDSHHVDLAQEVFVGLLHLLTSPSVLHINKNVNYAENGNYMKKVIVNVT